MIGTFGTSNARRTNVTLLNQPDINTHRGRAFKNSVHQPAQHFVEGWFLRDFQKHLERKFGIKLPFKAFVVRVFHVTPEYFAKGTIATQMWYANANVHKGNLTL